MGDVPSLVGVAVRVTVVPEQTLVLDVAIVTLGAILAVTAVVSVLLIAVLAVWQMLLAVRVTVTASPSARVASVYVLLLLPTLLPFFFH